MRRRRKRKATERETFGTVGRNDPEKAHHPTPTWFLSLSNCFKGLLLVPIPLLLLLSTLITPFFLLNSPMSFFHSVIEKDGRRKGGGERERLRLLFLLPISCVFFLQAAPLDFGHSFTAYTLPPKKSYDRYSTRIQIFFLAYFQPIPHPLP